MIEPRREAEFVECEVCLDRVRRSEAKSAELDDGFIYFCGRECCEEWEAEQRIEKTLEAGEP
jgi:hypothetical protein